MTLGPETLRIPKETVIKAIEIEPLRDGAWVYPARLVGDAIVDDAACSVCAVGATLRNLGWSNSQIRKEVWCYVDENERVVSPERNNTRPNVDLLLLRGKYLNALSTFFEGLVVQGAHMNDIRKTLVEWVKVSFPDELEIPRTTSALRVM